MLVVTLPRIGWNKARKKTLSFVAACGSPVNAKEHHGADRTYYYPQTLRNLVQISGSLNTRPLLNSLQLLLELLYG
jgi:hypothetical protein